jgi:hypothetical protein
VDALAESDRLHERVRAVVHAFERGRPPPETFDELAREVARFQLRHVEGYARLCAARGVHPDSIRCAADAPAVPTEAFKVASVFAFPAGHAAVTFRTSGTTGGLAAARGVHRVRDIATYDAASVAFARPMLMSGVALPVPVLVLGPSEREAPDSSLAHMCALFARAFGRGRRDRETFFVRGGALDTAGLVARAAELDEGSPALVLGTSFAYVHLLAALGQQRVPLPPGSRVMQTGGFKGKSREVDARTLRRELARTFGCDERAVIGEYGMTELSSQLWEATIADPAAEHGVYRAPPWVRVVAVDPETLVPLPVGATGLARIEDLTNVDSALAVLASDRVRGVADGIELLGRAPGATPRGCSIALDEMLAPSESGDAGRR